MTQHYTTVTSKGQVTIPQHIREQMNIKAGDKVLFDARDGGIRMHVKNLTIADLQNFMKGKSPVRATLEEIDAGIGKAITERYLRSLNSDSD